MGNPVDPEAVLALLHKLGIDVTPWQRRALLAELTNTQQRESEQ